LSVYLCTTRKFTKVEQKHFHLNTFFQESIQRYRVTTPRVA
jgi:hypothetical protein